MKLLICLTLVFYYSNTLAAGIYVKDLHKKCLSTNQKCMLTCAEVDPNGCTETYINENSLSCAENCLANYIKCEKILDTMRCLIDQTPILLEYKANYIPIEIRK